MRKNRSARKKGQESRKVAIGDIYNAQPLSCPALPGWGRDSSSSLPSQPWLFQSIGWFYCVNRREGIRFEHEQFLGDVTGDLSSKRAKIERMSERGMAKVVDAKVPLSEMFGYVTKLRSMTEGRASYTMEFDHYEEVPNNIAELIKDGKK